MNFWEKITGSDMTKEMKTFESRAKKLPADYQAAWEKIKANLWPHSDLTGRNLMPIFDGVLGLLEETAADGQPWWLKKEQSLFVTSGASNSTIISLKN
jgi:DNA-binding ferritin-like protein (Dps family)